MNKGLFFRLLICIGFFGFCLYSYIDMQNSITKLRIYIPQLTQQVRSLEEENTRFLYEIEAFESPENLMHLAKQNAFAYLKFPLKQEVLTLKEQNPLRGTRECIAKVTKRKPNITLATGANP